MFYNIDFYMPVRVISGEDCVTENAESFNDLGQKCLIITGKSSAQKSGALRDVVHALTSQGIAYEIYDRVGQNPMLSTCKEAGEMARKWGADFLVGIGGGSPLDATKAAAVFAANNIEGLKIFDGSYKNKPLKFALVGTTAGTGSEISRVSVMTVDGENIKKSVSHDGLYAAVSFCDPKYTYSLPEDITISTGIDTLAHAVEGYFSPNSTDISDMFALRAIKAVYKELKNILFNGFHTVKESGRKELLYGSILAGYTLNNCGTSFPHPMGYILTETKQVPHGKACAVFMPAYLKRAQEHEKIKTQAFLKACGEQYLNEVIDVVSKLTDCNVKMSEEEILSHASRFKDLKNFTNTPGGFTTELAVELMKELFKG